MPGCSTLFKQQDGIFAVIYKTNTTIHSVAKQMEQVIQTTREPPFNSMNRNIVPTMGHPFGHT